MLELQAERVAGRRFAGAGKSFLSPLQGAGKGGPSSIGVQTERGELGCGFASWSLTRQRWEVFDPSNM